MDAMAVEVCATPTAVAPTTSANGPMQSTSVDEVEMVVDVTRTDDAKKRPLESDGASAPVECFMCTSVDVKYRCPRCERITCSLACCVEHKKQFACDGKRDRTKYIPTKQFTDADLSSDFFFLEEISRSTNSAARSRSQLGVNVKRYGQQKQQQKKRRVGAKPETLAHGAAVNPHVPVDWLTRFPVAFQLLVQHAGRRGVALTLLAPGMSKRARNTSYMNTKEGKLFWRVEWIFPSAEVAVSLAEERADDSLTPLELLDKYLERRPENTSLRTKLKPYATPTWRNDVVLLLRKEFTATSQPQFYRVDGNLSLESNLKRKAVVEFPIITVVLRSELAKYSVANDLIEVVEMVDHPENDGSEIADDAESGDDDGEDVDEHKDNEEGEDESAVAVEASSQEDDATAADADAEMAE